MNKNYVPLYVLNSFLKFERKIYQVYGLPLGRPIKLKSFLYFLVFGLIELIIYFTPIIGNLINWLPFGILILIPVGLAWLLTDVGTEDRLPVNFFKSFVTYQIRKIKGNTYFRNRVIPKPRTYSFHNYFSYQEVVRPIDPILVEDREKAEKYRAKALRYIERITNPDEFFERLRKEKEQQKKNKKWKWNFNKKGA